MISFVKWCAYTHVTDLGPFLLLMDLYETSLKMKEEDEIQVKTETNIWRLLIKIKPDEY